MRQKLLSHRWVGEKMEAYVEEKCTTLGDLVPRVVFVKLQLELIYV